MNKRLYSLAKLLTELQAAKGLFQQSAQVYVAEKDSSSKPKRQEEEKVQTQKARKVVKAVGVRGAVKSRKASASDASSRVTRNRIVLFLRRRTILVCLFLWLQKHIAAVSTSTWCVDT
jgi:hypothetical protein